MIRAVMNNFKNINHLSNIEVFGLMTQPAKISCKFSCSKSFTSSWQANLKYKFVTTIHF